MKIAEIYLRRIIGELRLRELLVEKEVAVAENEKVKTVLVDVGDILIPMKGSSFPHVTIAVNPAADGKPFMSNQFSLNDFQPISPIILCGVIEETQ